MWGKRREAQSSAEMRSPALGSGTGSLVREEGDATSSTSSAKTKPFLERALRCSTRYFGFQKQTLFSVAVLFILMMIFVRLGKPPPGVCIFDIEGKMNCFTYTFSVFCSLLSTSIRMFYIVLMTKDFKPTSYGTEAQNQCKLRGHDVAVIALNVIDENYPYEKEFLKSYFPKIWTPTLLESHALQLTPKPTKKESFEAISSYFDRDLHCTVLISNRMSMSEVINDYGVNYVQIKEPDDSIERIGLTKAVVDLAILSLYTTCQDINSVEELEKGNLKKGGRRSHQTEVVDCTYISPSDYDCINSISGVSSSKTEEAIVCGCTKKNSEYFLD